ncbi:MAG TPA: hypothetical protein VKP00_13365, partial [Gemmatimonadaceae bacterium]|nr:hypothetical protein [Gemmatimonadaceae bacterium]
MLALSCNEHLPSGPGTFAVTIKMTVPRDTLVVGDSAVAQAVATDANGSTIQSLSFAWTSADATVLGFAAPTATPDAASGRTRTFVGQHAGRSVVTLALPDSRFVAPNDTKTETVVVGGVKILSTHDSTLTAVNDTGFAIAEGLVRVNGALVTRVSQSLRWIHLGSHTALVGTGDTVRYIALSNGADTLIATHDFCLASAKCRDTLVVHVSQQLTMTLSAHAFLAWSFSDSLGPTVTLADRRGNGLPGSSVRFIPATAADSQIVKVTPSLGANNLATGLMAAPRLVSKRNGNARVGVFAVAADGISIVAVDSITEVVRQVARLVMVEPLRAVVTVIDSIPVRRLARDARGAVIADATVTATAAGITFNGAVAGPNPSGSTSTQGTLTPTLTGIALPEFNPLAPQVPVVVVPAVIKLIHLDTVIAGATARVATMTVLDSNGVAAVGSWVRFRPTAGVTPDSVQVDAGGAASVAWFPPNISGPYTLTGVRGAPPDPVVLGDSSVRTVLQQSVVVVAGAPSAAKSTLAISATTIAAGGTATLTITVKDVFGNVVTTATPADFTAPTALRGTVG